MSRILLRPGVLTVALSLTLVSCSSTAGSSTASSNPSPTTPTVASTTSSSTTIPPTTTTPSTSAATTTTLAQITERQFGFIEPFRVTIPTSWTRAEESTQKILYLDTGSNTIVFGEGDFATVDDWVSSLVDNEGLESTEPVPIEIGGAPGYSIDVGLSSAATNAGCQNPEPCVSVLSEGFGWAIFPNLPNRLWIVDVEGRPILIAAEASEGSFESFTATAQDALDTLVWGEG